jgi:LysR family transcriptional activator of nhaA
MHRLNYDHLLYFWTVMKEGSVAAACKSLLLAQPTISGQLRVLERALGHKLFERRGRGLVPTEMGRIIFRYADDIFSIGTELLDAVRGRTPDDRLRLRVGVADVLPKLVVYRMLLPVLSLPEKVRVVCYEGKHPDLVARLAVHDLDVVLGDAPVAPYAGIAAYNHRLGESSLRVFGTATLARKFRRGFPRSLDGAPFLLSTPNTAVRRSLDHWFESEHLRPRVAGEFEDSALLKVFGQSGVGLFVAPGLIEAEIRTQYNVKVVGRLPTVKEQFYAVSMERKIKHPAVVVLTDTAKARLFVAE